METLLPNVNTSEGGVVRLTICLSDNPATTSPCFNGSGTFGGISLLAF